VAGASDKLSSGLAWTGVSMRRGRSLLKLQQTLSDITHKWRHIEDSTGTGGHGFLFSVHGSTGFCSSATSFIGSKKKKKLSLFSPSFQTPLLPVSVDNIFEFQICQFTAFFSL